MRYARRAAIIAGGVAIGLWVAGCLGYLWLEGATHPTIDRPRPKGSPALLWSGALRPDGATVVAALRSEVDVAPTLTVTGDGFEEDSTFEGEFRGGGAWGAYHFELEGLSPGESYDYSLNLGGDPIPGGEGHLRTPKLGPQSFKLALGSCAQTGSRGVVFREILKEEPLLFLHMGDMHYENIVSSSPLPYVDAYKVVHNSPSQRALYREVPIAYVWDDHDYGSNDSDSLNPGRAAVHQAFAASVPHHPLALSADGGPIARAFSLGRVRVIITDMRSQRSPLRDKDGPHKTHLGASQRAWLIGEMIDARETHPLIIWVSTVAWIGDEPGRDGWSHYRYERRIIAEAMEREGLTDQVLIVSGDAHMLAFDDGTNSNYAGGEGLGPAVFHAAALDRFGSIKGGPYSGGAFPDGGQYGVLDINDEGEGAIEVEVLGKRWDGEVVIDESLSFPRDLTSAP